MAGLGGSSMMTMLRSPLFSILSKASKLSLSYWLELLRCLEEYIDCFHLYYSFNDKSNCSHLIVFPIPDSSPIAVIVCPLSLTVQDNGQYKIRRMRSFNISRTSRAVSAMDLIVQCARISFVLSLSVCQPLLYDQTSFFGSPWSLSPQSLRIRIGSCLN